MLDRPLLISYCYAAHQAEVPAMTLSTLAAYSFALFVVALIPGPGITALVARALGAGFAESFAMALGIMLGDVVFLSAVVLGLSVLAQTFGTVFLIIKFLGVAYLVWLAVKMWRTGVIRTDIVSAPRRTIAHSFLSGLFVTLGNPKAMLFYVALVPTLVSLDRIRFASYLELVAITFVVLTIVTVPYILLAAKARDFLRHPAALKRVNRVSASFLAGTAAYIALRSN
jgi:threonine/homoserine/homoserine lactone efflux protein